MPRYIQTARVVPAYVEALLKAPSNREEGLRQILAGTGATLEHYFFSPDSMEAILVWDCDDPSRLDGSLLASAASGFTDTSTWGTRRILTGAELAETARGADASIYRPPGA